MGRFGRGIAVAAALAVVVVGCGQGDPTARLDTPDEVIAAVSASLSGSYRWTAGVEVDIDRDEFQQIVERLGGYGSDTDMLSELERQDDRAESFAFLGSKADDRSGSFGVSWRDRLLFELSYDLSDAPPLEQLEAAGATGLDTLGAFDVGVFAQIDVENIEDLLAELFGGLADPVSLREEMLAEAERELADHPRLFELVVAFLHGDKVGVAGTLDASEIEDLDDAGAFGEVVTGSDEIPSVDRDDLVALARDVLVFGTPTARDDGHVELPVSVDFARLDDWTNGAFGEGAIDGDMAAALDEMGLVANIGTLTFDAQAQLTEVYVNLIPVAGAYAKQTAELHGGTSISAQDVDDAIALARNSRIGIVLGLSDHGRVPSVDADSAVTIDWSTLFAAVTDLHEAPTEPSEDPALQSELRNAAVAMESWWAEHSTYAVTLEDLHALGYYLPGHTDVDVRLVWADDAAFCLEAAGGAATYHLLTSTAPAPGPCPPAPPGQGSSADAEGSKAATSGATTATPGTDGASEDGRDDGPTHEP